MWDPNDGGLKHCHAKRGEFMAQSDPCHKTWKCRFCGMKPCKCNGMLTSEDTITSYISQKSKKEKDTAAKESKNREKDREEEQLMPGEGIDMEE